MSQRINRSQHGTEKGNSQYDGAQSQRENPSPFNQNDQQNNEEGGDDKQNPIVALEPEVNYRGGTNFMGSQKQSMMGT
jgi:hypothetical protein